MIYQTTPAPGPNYLSVILHELTPASNSSGFVQYHSGSEWVKGNPDGTTKQQ